MDKIIEINWSEGYYGYNYIKDNNHFHNNPYNYHGLSNFEELYDMDINDKPFPIYSPRYNDFKDLKYPYLTHENQRIIDLSILYSDTTLYGNTINLHDTYYENYLYFLDSKNLALEDNIVTEKKGG